MNKKTDFTNAKDLLALCEAKNIPISEAMFVPPQAGLP